MTIHKIFVTVYLVFSINYAIYHNSRVLPDIIPPTITSSRVDSTDSTENVTTTVKTHTNFHHRRNSARYVGTLEDFMVAIGQSEGHGEYTAVNKRGYMGLYQFHDETLKSIGYSVSRSDFLNDPDLQDSAMVNLLKHNARALHWVIRHRVGTWHNGVYLTKSGLLAGAHLVGPGGVLAWLYPTKYHYRTSDSNGMSVAVYIKQFGGYDLRRI